MYILIDMDKMRFVAKHPNFAVLSELGVIMCSEAQEVIPMDVKAFETFGDVEFQMLYINLTGNQTGALYDRKTAAQILVDYLNECEETYLGPWEVSKQCDYVLENDLQGQCTYVAGSTVPSIEQDLWTYLAKPLSMPREELLSSGNAETVIKPPVQAPFQPQVERVTSTQANSDQPTAPRDGSVRDVIWTKADELWIAAGKPTDKSEILKLRRAIMAALELEGVKKTSSSNELGKWHLNRAPY